MLDCSCDVRDAEQKILILYFIRMKGSLLCVLPSGAYEEYACWGPPQGNKQTRVIADFCDGSYSYGFNV